MNKALLAALASFALVGASCSVQDFSTVVMEAPSIFASYSDASSGSLIPITQTRSTPITSENVSDYYGKYSFKFGHLNANLVNYDLFVPGYEMDGSTGEIIENSYRYRSTTKFTPCKSSTTYYKSYDTSTYGDGFNVYCYDTSKNFISRVAYYNVQSFVTPSNAAYFRFESTIDRSKFMLNEGDSLLPYAAYGYGFSYVTPASGVGSALLNMYAGADFAPVIEVFYEHDGFTLYTDALHFNFGGNNALLEDFKTKFYAGFASGSHSGLSLGNSYVYGNDLIIPFVVANYSTGGSATFEVEGNYQYQRGYHDGYYDAVRDNGIFNHAYSLTGTDGTNTVTNYIDDSLLEWYASANTQGLFDPYDLVSFLGLSSSATSYSITIQYGEVYASSNFPLAAYPLYLDVLSDGVVEDTTLCPSLRISTYRGGSIRGFTLFDADFTQSYAGLATGYPNPDVYNREYDTFNRISLYLPKNQSYADMRQFGVVSPYARGYVDGVTSRDGEVDGLTQRILDLQNDLSQYRGKTYQQIYDAGFQAGLDEENQGAATFNSLFGNILSAPLTILNGLTDISFFGMPILTAILSLLMVAMALFLFKRFK